MKQLINEELKKVDSTKETITKWDVFLKKALWNMGFKQETIDGMYPYTKITEKNGIQYQAGIPMKDGTVIPIAEQGRVIFKNSIADKLALAFSELPLRVAPEAFVIVELSCIETRSITATLPVVFETVILPALEIKDVSVMLPVLLPLS